MSAALRSIPCHSDEELVALAAGDEASLAELARFSGTDAGDQATAGVQRHLAMVRREIARRNGGESC